MIFRLYSTSLHLQKDIGNLFVFHNNPNAKQHRSLQKLPNYAVKQERGQLYGRNCEVENSPTGQEHAAVLNQLNKPETWGLKSDEAMNIGW